MDWANVIGITSVLVAIIIAYRQSKKNSIATQATLLCSILGSINEYHTKLIELNDEEQKAQFKEVLLNELEFYALMVNTDIIKDDRLSSFFNEGYREMYEELKVNEHEVEHDEMKTLYDQLSRNAQIKSNRRNSRLGMVWLLISKIRCR